MGLSDRDYMHERGGRPSFSPTQGLGLRGISVTLWLIILCVGIYVVDGFLPMRWELMRVQWSDAPEIRAMTDAQRQALLPTLTPSRLVVPGRPGQPIVPGMRGYRLLSEAGGRDVAREEYRAVPFLNSLLYFSTSRALVHQTPDGSLRGFEFWRFIGFQFLHAGIWHLAFNMIGLWFFGPIVERTLGGKRFLAFYLLCGIFGALMYLLLNAAGSALIMFFGAHAADWAPFVLFNDPATPLVGASAGVFGILMAGAYLVPHATVLVYGVLPMRLDTMAYVLVVIALLGVFFRWDNAGGEAAHLGGAIAGYYFIRHPHHLHGFFDFLGRVDPTSRSRRARLRGDPLRAGEERFVPRGAAADPREVDRILRKVSEQGIHALTGAERETLRRAGGSQRP